MRRLALLVLLLPLGLACGGDNGGNGGNGGITDPVDTGDFPLGTFVKTLELADVEDLLPESDLRYSVGTFRATYYADGTFSVSFVGENHSTGVGGTFAVSGDRVTISERDVLGLCTQRAAVNGTYTWSFDGSALSFSVVSDDCLVRSVNVTVKPFIKE